MIDNISDKSVIYNDKRKNIVFKENRSEYRASNIEQKNVIAYKIDGSMIENGNKCDNGLGIPEKSTLYLIELKGCDVDHACIQLDATIEFIKERISKDVCIKARIVASHVKPELFSTKYKALSRKIKNINPNGDLISRTRLLEEEI